MTSAEINPFLHLQRNADTNPHGIFSKSASQVMTNAEALVSVKKLAYEFRRLGVKANQIVALDLPDQLRIVFLEAVYHEAAVGTVLPDGYIADGILQVDWIFTSGNSTPQQGATVVQVDKRFLQRVEENPYGITASDESGGILWITFSSGTTGTPNAIPLTRSTLAALEGSLDAWFEGDPFLILMDLGTAWGFGGFFLSVKTDRPFLCVGNAGQEEIVRIAAENSVTSLKGSTAQFARFVDELERQQRVLPSIETVWFGGTMMPPGVADRLRRVTDGCRIYGTYGSTEATVATTRLYESDDPTDAGQVLPGSDVEIVDEDDKVVPTGTAGRIRHRSTAMAHEYLGNPRATARAFRDGWFYSGDLGYLRADGGLTLTGRESELLNAGGVKIDPNRVDQAAIRYPHVSDACTFEYSAESGLKQVGIALVADDDVDVPGLIAALKTEFGPAVPSLVARVEVVPRNAMGKPMRMTLAEKYREN